MITAKIQRFVDGSVKSFTVSGHAGYAEEGYDIICSAVSAVSYTALGYIDEVLRKNFNKSVKYKEEDGLMSYERDENSNDERVKRDIDAVLEAMVIGLKQINASYGKSFLTLTEEENPNA